MINYGKIERAIKEFETRVRGKEIGVYISVSRIRIIRENNAIRARVSVIDTNKCKRKTSTKIYSPDILKLKRRG
jgi:hypothetical protein